MCIRDSGQTASDDDDRRDADELGVLELHTRRHATSVVVDNVKAFVRQLACERLGRDEDFLVLSGRHDVDVGGRDLPRPAQPELVVVALGDAGDGPRDPDPCLLYTSRCV